MNKPRIRDPYKSVSGLFCKLCRETDKLIRVHDNLALVPVV